MNEEKGQKQWSTAGTAMICFILSCLSFKTTCLFVCDWWYIYLKENNLPFHQISRTISKIICGFKTEAALICNFSFISKYSFSPLFFSPIDPQHFILLTNLWFHDTIPRLRSSAVWIPLHFWLFCLTSIACTWLGFHFDLSPEFSHSMETQIAICTQESGID